MVRQVTDISGQRFGRLTAIRYAANGYWVAKCDCGAEVSVLGGELRGGRKRSCGNITCRQRKHDLLGKRFGFLQVIEHGSRGTWICKCECGGHTKVQSSVLVQGRTLSCGCLIRSDGVKHLLEELVAARAKIRELEICIDTLQGS